ncbi:phage tail protein [Paenibacillus sp. TRM 82003]|nr:phage tail protein [Paenibacillus sp. TRM 82003]
MNGPQYFSLRRPPDFRRGAAIHATIREEGLAIVRQDVYRPSRRDEADHPRFVRPIGDASPDPDGRWLLLDRAAGVWKADLASGHVETLLAAGHGWFGRTSSIAALGDMWAVADADSVPTLLLLSSDNAQVLWTKADWNGEPYRAYALASDAAECLVVLARFGADESEAWRLLRYESSGAEAGALELEAPGPAADDAEAASTPHSRAERRFDLALDAEGGGWLLDRASQRYARFTFGGESDPAPIAFVPVPGEASPVTAVQAGPDGSCWALRQADGGIGRQLLRLDREGAVRERGDAGGGAADRLFVGADGRLFVWENEDAIVTTLRPTRETAVWERLGRRFGVWIGCSLDSTSIETEWHKLVVDADAAPDTQIRIRYYASDSKRAVAGGKLVDLDAYIADETIDPYEKWNGLRALWSEPIVDPTDALLFDTKGRYLWLIVELIGSEAHTPILRGIQAHFPRETYVNDLPAVFQQDRASKDFLDRYLSLFQTLMEETDERIAQVPRSFDPEASSGKSLRWLLGWLGLDADDHWTDEQLRQLLRHAPTIYKLRGTRYAIETLVSIYTGEKPIILEYDQLKPLKENPELGSVAEKLYATEPNGFNVLVKPEHADTETKRVTLQHLIDRCKPAFTTAKLIVLQPWVYMDLHSYLGLNTVLSEPTLLQLDGQSSMPHHTITIDVGQDNRVDQHTRLELDSRLE